MSDAVKAYADGLYALYNDGADQPLIDTYIASMTSEQRALVAIHVRDERLRLEKESEKLLAPLKQIQEDLGATFLSEMNQSGETTMRGAGWRVTLSTSYNAAMPDTGAFYDFLSKTHRFDMLQRRLSSTAVKEYYDENQSLPAGVTLHAVNKATFYRK